MQLATMRRVQGQVLTPESPGYDEARRAWNAIDDGRPEVIVRCVDALDVTAALEFARERGVSVAVRSAGHSMAGYGSGDGMVIDLSPMRAIDIDPIRRVARVEPGLTCHDVAQALRPYGLAVDNLRSVELIAADGQFLTASADDNPELFWGLRAGGGNFGIATAFEFDLHPAGVIAARTA